MSEIYIRLNHSFKINQSAMTNIDKTIFVKPCEISKVIGDYNLHIYKNIWHYSFNESFQCADFKFKEMANGENILYSSAYNQFSPSMIYVNAKSKVFLQEANAIQKEYDPKNKAKRSIYWFLRTDTFYLFLDRRSNVSLKPRKHFPSRQSYSKFRERIRGEMVFDTFNKRFFFEHYNRLKKSSHLSGEEVYALFLKNNPDINLNWLYMATLCHDGSIVAIGLIINDGKSINLENISAKRESLSFGVILCTELVKYCCENNLYSFDAGVSGIYGSYKQKIFLDSKEIFKEPEKYSKYFHFWKISYWNKVGNRVKNIMPENL